MPNVLILKCGKCGVENAVSKCARCDRSFVVTADHVSGRLRAFESMPFAKEDSMTPEYCDFCTLKSKEASAIEKITAGLRQRTCANCHTEFLSDHGF